MYRNEQQLRAALTAACRWLKREVAEDVEADHVSYEAARKAGYSQAYLRDLAAIRKALGKA